MDGFRLVVAVINVVVALAVTTSAVLLAVREVAKRFRASLLALAAIGAIFTVGSVQRLLLSLVDAGLAPTSVEDLLLSWGQLVLSVVALAAMTAALGTFPKAWTSAADIERVVRVMVDRPVDVGVGELGLTARELTVVEVMLEGAISDREIAEALSVAPSTAGTHVRNIMRKAGVSNRRDLLFLDEAGE